MVESCLLPDHMLEMKKQTRMVEHRLLSFGASDRIENGLALICRRLPWHVVRRHLLAVEPLGHKVADAIITSQPGVRPAGLGRFGGANIGPIVLNKILREPVRADNTVVFTGPGE